LPEGGTTGDGGVSLEPVHCLGLCAASPAALLDETPHARLTPARLDGLLATVEAAA
jgi:formate dehydrogenase subunit gamma